jgi:TRAP-type C4-dicarboxylate transport system substrate-binding protein
MLIPGGVFKTAGEVYTAVSEELFSQYWPKYGLRPILKSEWGSQAIWLKDGFVEDWDSLKGKQVRTWSRETADMITALGGSPVTMAYAEVYTALQTGLLDGVVTSAEGMFTGRLTEIVKNGSFLAALYPVLSYVVNEKALAELPPDVRDAFLGLMADRYNWFQEGNIKGEGMALQAMVLLDFVKIHPFPKDFRTEVREAAYETMWTPWMERAGPEGVAAFNTVAQVLLDMGLTVPGYQP